MRRPPTDDLLAEAAPSAPHGDELLLAANDHLQRSLEPSTPLPTWVTPAETVIVTHEGSNFVWETMWVGPETMALHRHAGPPSVAPRALAALISAATEPPIGALQAILSAEEASYVASLGFRSVLECSAGLLAIWVRPSADSLHRTPQGTWVSYQNPEPLPISGDWRIEPATLEHVTGMVAVDAAEYLEPLSERDIAEAVTRYPCAVAIRGDAVIGMAVTRDMVGATGVLGELFTIVTHPRQRSRGLGAALLSRVEQMGFAAGWEAICLESSMAYGSRYKTSPAPFYLRHGWTLLAINESTIYMAKTQPGGPATILASV